MEKKRFLDFLDMIDGGGAGQMGDKFEGGGLLSALGNALGSPYGSEDPERRAARQAFYGSDQIGGGLMAMPNQPQVIPRQDNYTVDAFEPNYADRFGVPAPVPPMQYGPPARSLVGPQLSAALNPTSEGAPAPAAPMQYGPPARSLVGPQLSAAMNQTPAGTLPAPSETPQERFARQLTEMMGPEEAQRLMNSGMASQAYQAFVANNYNMPNY